MRYSILTAAVLAAALALAPAAYAKKATGKHARAKAAPAQMVEGGFVQAAPRMIEIRPGYWVSSYGCVTDEGQGRLRDCSISDGKQ